ncbi:hypothetical protein M404DRAFT_29422 [Pisolithus tinctorius Marx 270]|uniref:CCHC-type domain-containing protein n=1 Tax=Pisolithus tinctorius Marx 270 TaxID=870435 RepID=A0A0C3IUG7_PISTI|nr:hypothetical protein M404DRAFT_29422 [Pisolithus tinctorius Marx 270]
MSPTSNTPTPCHPTAPIPKGDPGDDGPGNDDDNNPDDDDPGNGPGDDNPDENDLEDKLDFPDPDTKPTITVLDNLTAAIKLTKLHKPDTFDGTDPKKLCAFFIQCELNFQDHLWAFRTNHAKVIFMQSYLKGMALKWFKPDLLTLNNPNDWPLWMDSWRDNNKSGGSGNNNQPKTSSNINSGPSPKLASLKLGNNNSNSSKPEPSKLRKDGKFTPEECKCCIEGNLCMFCGGPGHFTEKCPKKTGKAKAHATATTKAALASGLGPTPKTKK